MRHFPDKVPSLLSWSSPSKWRVWGPHRLQQHPLRPSPAQNAQPSYKPEVISPSAIIPIHTVRLARHTSGNGFSWLGKGWDLQTPRAVHLGSRVSIAAALGLLLLPSPGRQLSCELGSLLFPALSRSDCSLGFLKLLLSYSPRWLLSD